MIGPIVISATFGEERKVFFLQVQTENRSCPRSLGMFKAAILWWPERDRASVFSAIEMAEIKRWVNLLMRQTEANSISIEGRVKGSISAPKGVQG